MPKTPRLLLTVLLAATLALPACAAPEQPKDSGTQSEVTGEPAYGTLVNLNTEENTGGALEGMAVPNYHLYGYDVLNAGYIHTQDVKDRPILDPAKFDATLYTAADQSGDDGSEVLYASSTRMNEFYSKFNSDVSAEYKGVAFGGKVDTEFGVEKQTTSTQTFIRYIQYHTIYKTAFVGEDEDLIAMLAPQFKADLVKYKDDPAAIFDRYGTHLITKYYLGGRADLSFMFNNTTSATQDKIKGSVQATYGRISGSATAEDVEKSKLVLDNSTLTLKTYGGDFISGTTVDSLATQFPAWLKSIESKPNICRLGNWSDSMYPIWELVEDQETAAKLKAEFDRQAKGRTIAMDGMVDISDPVPAKDYITDIVVLSAGSKDAAKAKLPKGYTLVYLNPGSDKTDDFDCNYKAGGDYIYLAYPTSPDKSGAITDIYTASGKSTKFSGFTKIDHDLNRNAGGDYIYLFYRKATQADQANAKTTYLREIRGAYGKISATTLPSGWKWIPKNVDLNKGAGGAFVYVAVRKD